MLNGKGNGEANTSPTPFPPVFLAAIKTVHLQERNPPYPEDSGWLPA